MKMKGKELQRHFDSGEWKANERVEHYRKKAEKEAEKKKAGQVICPNVNCGYIGKPSKQPRGNIGAGLVLCLFFLLPGILYFMFKSGYRYKCPNCSVQIAIDN